jgi:hypothetical protein
VTTSTLLPEGALVSNRLYWVLWSAILVLLLAPVWLTTYVPLVDLPLHMGRAHAYAYFDQDPAFAAHLSLSPNWVHNAAVELVLSPLVKIWGVERATQWFLTLYILLFAAGCHLLGCATRAPVGRGGFGPPSPAMLPCLFLSYHSIYLYGMVNFAIGVAAALFTLALRIAWARHWTVGRVAVLTILCTITYLFHLSTFAILGIAWGLWQLAEWWEQRRFSFWDLASFLAFVPGAILYLLYGRTASSGPTRWPTLSHKALHLATGFTSYTPAVTVLALLACAGGLAVAMWYGRRRLALAPLLTAVVFLLLFLAAPDEFHGATDVDVRFAPLIFCFFAAALPMLAGRLGVVLLGVVLAGFTIRQADIIRYSQTAGAEMERLLPSIDAIERNALVYPHVWLDPDPTVSKRHRHLIHFPALAIARHHIRYATLALTPRGTWPLEARKDFEHGVLIPPYGSFARLDWPRLRKERCYFWTFGLPATALAELAPYTKTVYEDGPVRVLRVEVDSEKP